MDKQGASWDRVQIGAVAVLLLHAAADHFERDEIALPLRGLALLLFGLAGAGKTVLSLRTGVFDALGRRLQSTRLRQPRIFAVSVTLWGLLSLVLIRYGLRGLLNI